ncbi:MAG: HAD family phosphatase [Clostridiales bacterium]|nr:HAD family phosphatase [Clostridiales bacterium]
MDKRFAIFDMDGTLVDSMGFWQRLSGEYLASRGVTENLEAVQERVRAMTILESAALFAALFHLPDRAEDVAAQMNAMMDGHYRRDIPLKRGVLDYLKRLRQAGVRMCVASATSAELMEACLSRLGAAEIFEFLLSCEEVGSGKSRPDVFLEAARRLGAQPGEIAVYEDALHAAQTAKSAGFYTVAVYDESGRPEWEKLRALADEAITDWPAAVQTL